MPPSLAERPHPMRSLLILSVAALAFALAQTTLIPALGELARELDTDASGVAWTLTGYLLSAAVCTPIFGRLGDMFGKRRLLVISLGVFAGGSVVAALANSLNLLVAGRVLQGAGGGIFPLCFAIIRDEFPREKVSSSIGLISATFGIGGGAGLIIGGVLVDGASYHWIFWLGAAMAAAAAVLTQLMIPESPNRSPGRVDFRGAAVLALGLTMPLLAIARANAWGWGSPRTLVLIGSGVAVLAFWVWLQKRTVQPLADVELLGRPPVLMTNIATLLVGFGMFGSFVLIPQLAEAPSSTGYGFGLDATGAGLLMLPGALVMLVAGPFAGVLVRRFGGKVPLASGALISSFALFMMGVDHGTQGAMVAWNIILSVGIGLSFAAMPNLIFDAVPQSETGEATGFNTLVRSVGASLGSQISAAILTGSVVAGTLLPSDAGYTTAFLVSSAIAVVAAIVSIAIPRTGDSVPVAARPSHAPEPAYAKR
ncbi:MAG TPA: MFS transporter [Solirubrobacteraceae bacterium]|nr:MFS transporter [Solirubrobacteraceae bacterium]